MFKLFQELLKLFKLVLNLLKFSLVRILFYTNQLESVLELFRVLVGGVDINATSVLMSWNLD